MKKLYRTILAVVMLSAFAPVQAYTIGNSYATLISCDFSYNAEYMASGYTGTYQTNSGNIYRIWFGSSYCAY